MDRDLKAQFFPIIEAIAYLLLPLYKHTDNQTIFRNTLVYSNIDNLFVLAKAPLSY